MIGDILQDGRILNDDDICLRWKLANEFERGNVNEVRVKDIIDVDSMAENAFDSPTQQPGSQVGFNSDTAELPKRLSAYFRLMEERPESFRNTGNLEIVVDVNRILQYEKDGGAKIGILYSSGFSLLVVDLVDNQGLLYPYERVLPAVRTGAVVAVPIWKSQLVLINQYRHSIRSFQLCFPRGFGEMGLSTEDNLRKELEEELNAAVLSFKHIGCVTGDSGVIGNAADVFQCEISEPSAISGYEGIENLLLVTPAELQKLVAQGGITDGFTLSAIALIRAQEAF